MAKLTDTCPSCGSPRAGRKGFSCGRSSNGKSTELCDLRTWHRKHVTEVRDYQGAMEKLAEDDKRIGDQRKQLQEQAERIKALETVLAERAQLLANQQEDTQSLRGTLELRDQVIADLKAQVAILRADPLDDLPEPVDGFAQLIESEPLAPEIIDSTETEVVA